MAVYMVERHLPGITPEQLASAQRAAIACSKRFSNDEHTIRYIRSTFVPGEDRCLCLFEAPAEEMVRQVNESAKLPFTRILEALDLTPLVVAAVILAGAMMSACAPNPAAPSRASAAIPQVLSSSAIGHVDAARSAASCSNIDLTVTAVLQPDGTAAGSVSGDLTGPVAATIQKIDASGDGALHVLLRHQFTNITPFGEIGTSDHAVLAPMDKAASIYRMNNRLTIVVGAGIYAGASGSLDAHGTVDFSTGTINLRESGRVCVP